MGIVKEDFMSEPQTFAEKATPAPDTANRGCLTQVPLYDVRRLCLPPAPGPFGHMRPPLNRTALEMSLELAYMTYTLDLEPWMHSGWTDVSIQVDNRLASGVTVGESESAASDRVRNLMNAWKVARARQALRTRNPLSQLRGALRQRERSDTIKAVTMMHDAPGGRFVVAIGFMGTGSRFYDWFSNFRLMADQGFHRGFAQLTDTFEQSADRILFPATAARMGRTMLTLRDVLGEMRAPDSRFSLWMAGHSQGGAVMQVFCHRLLDEWGVLPRHVVGYGFASPTVASGATGRDPAAYPLCHLLNADDLVPRVGALMHLGLCLRYSCGDGDALRAAAYGWEDTPEACDLRAQAETLMEPITDTPTMLTAMAALSETVLSEKTGENLEALMDKWWSIAPMDWALQLAEGKAKESLSRMARYARVAYRTLTGARMDETAVAGLRDVMTPVVRTLPARRLIAALSDRYHPPHMNYCEVTLVFDNTDRQLPLDYTEVSITRRVYRSGESEYLLNGSACRLKDVVDLFRDTGVGKEGYSIIGQGRIDEILSQRSEDRRAVFEEAAGISRFRARKEEAEQRLKRSDENLVRVEDVLEELSRQLGPLEKQADVAREYLALSETLKELDIELYLLRQERLSKRASTMLALSAGRRGARKIPK